MIRKSILPLVIILVLFLSACNYSSLPDGLAVNFDVVSEAGQDPLASSKISDVTEENNSTNDEFEYPASETDTENGLADSKTEVQIIPYVGMPESSLSSVSYGGSVTIEKCRDFDMLDYGHRYKTYYWYDSAGTKKCVATIYYNKDQIRHTGYVASVEFYPQDPYGNPIN